MKSQIDLRDVMLEAQAEVMAIARELRMELSQPQMMAQIRALWGSMPEEVKESFKMERPQDYAALMKDLKGAKNG